MYGQMTAGSWIYIGSQGIVQGTFETFVEAGRQHYGNDLSGKWILTAGLGAWAARSLAATLAGAVSLNIECQQSSIDFRLRTRYVDKQARDIDHALELIRQHCDAKEAVSIALLGNAAEVLPELVRRAKAGGLKPDLVTDQTSAHDLIHGYLPAGWTVPQWQAAMKDPAQHAVLTKAAAQSCAVHVQAMLDFQAMGIPTVDYGNNIRQVAFDEGVKNAFDFPGFVPAYIRPLFCEGKGPFRWVALSGDPEDIYKTDAKIKELFPDNHHTHRWLDMARERIAFQGLPARICWLGLGERHKAALAFNDMVRSGEPEGAHRHRPRSPGHRIGRQSQPRDRGHEGRHRRGERLAAAERAAQHGGRRHVGEPAPWRRRGHGLLAACRRGHRGRRHRRGGRAPGPGAVERPGLGRDAACRCRLRHRRGHRAQARLESSHGALRHPQGRRKTEYRNSARKRGTPFPMAGNGGV